MNTLATPELGAAASPPHPELSLARALGLLAHLRLLRWRNRLRRVVGTRAPATSVAASLAWALLPLAFLSLFSLQSFQLFEDLAHAHGLEAVRARALLLSSLLCGAVLFSSASGSSLQGRPADDELDWLLTLPVRAWVLQAAKLGEAALLNPFGWMVLFPFLTGLGLHVGLGAGAPLVAVVLCLPLFAAGALLQALSDAANGWLASLPALRAARAVVGGLGVLIFSFWLALPALARSNLVSIGEWPALSGSLDWLPLSEPALVILWLPAAPLAALGWLGLFAAEAGVLLGLGVLVLRSARARFFLVGSVARRAARGGALTGADGRSWFGPVVAKDLLWLRRNGGRTAGLMLNVALANTAAILWLSRAAEGDAARWGAAVLGVGSWMLLLLGALLESERPALWQLATLPRSIHRLFLPKALFAACLACGATVPVLVHCAQTSSSWTIPSPGIAYALTGLMLLSFLQTALWLRRVTPSVATSPLQHAWRLLQLMFVAGLFAAGLASTSVLGMVPPLVLTAALTLAAWQDALARVPFALDASAERAPRPSPLFALVAVLVLRVLQSQLQLTAAAAGMSPALALVGSFVVAGVAVVSASLLWLHVRGVTKLSEHLALGGAARTGKALWAGVAWSVPAITFSAGYWLLRRWAWPAQATPLSTLVEASPGAFASLTVLAAPLVEELLFRGLLYRSLRASNGVWLSLLLSSAVFAVGHPSAAVLPLLGLGACAALALERSRSLLAAILVHALYNGCIAAVTIGL